MNQVTDKVSTMGLVAGSKLVGRVSYVAKDKDGNIIETGKVTNNIVLGIRKPIIALLSGYMKEMADMPVVTQIALGTGSTAPTINDQALEEEITGSRKLTATAPTIAEDGLSTTFSFLYNADDANVDGKDVKEMGLFTSDGSMIARTTVGLWRKSAGLYFEVYWTIGYAAS